jgi:very-short-patch-repair endonuclease
MQNIDDKIERWKKRLLDLNKRNRLINFRETKRSNVGITSPNYGVLYKRLVLDEDELSFPFPLKTTYDENGEEHNISVQDGDLQTNKTLNEQQKTLKVLRGRAKTSMEEQGINSLYLTFGIIRWKESDTSEILISAPLVLVPVTLTVESISDPYILHIHEDEIVVNPSLAFKFENDFGITLPEFDGHEDDIIEYLSVIAKIAKKNDWEVVTDVHLTLLSFLKINMYKDLDNNKDKIVSSPIIKALCGDKSDVAQIPGELNNFDHDKNVRPIETYQVVDADSSQQDAILLSKKGISFVLQGPPGTGKSQTITNIIAESISDGKKVLFVSEKMAALEVVKKRLTEAGLDDFCLTLHSYKANKKEILNQLAKTLAVQKISLREDALYKLSVLEERRNKLNEYQEQLHTKCMPLNLSIYEANGRLAKLSATQDIIFGINSVEFTNVEKLNKYRYLLSEFSKTIGRLSKDYAENPWYGCNVPVVTHELRHDIEVNIRSLSLKLKSLTQTYEYILNKTTAHIAPTINNIPLLVNLLDVSSDSPVIPIKWLSEDLGFLKSIAQEYLNLFNEHQDKTITLLERYAKDVLDLDAKDIIFTIESNMTGVKLHLDNKSFPTKKDIVAKANYIISECRELKIFIQQINDKSKDMHLVLGVNQDRTFNAILELDKLLELILKNPRPINNWFTNGKIQSINKLVDLAKAEQALIDNNLTGIRSIFRDDILNINYDELFIKFKTTYVHTLKAISDFNGLSDNLQLNKQTILSFVDNQLEKINAFHLLITSGYDISQKLIDSIGIKSISTVKGLISLGGLLSTVIRNPNPTLAWFDENKEIAIDSIISDIKNIQKEIKNETDMLLSHYHKDILNIDYRNMLFRFNTEYGSFLKFFKGNYNTDKKIVRGFSKEPNNKITDNEIIALLNKIALIKEKEQWLSDSRPLATEMLGSSYIGDYTNWDNILNNRTNFKIIGSYFNGHKIPEKLKKLLLEGNVEKFAEQNATILKIEDYLLEDFMSIFGPNIVSEPISDLLDKIYTTKTMLLDIQNDLVNIYSYSINTNSTEEIKLTDVISTLTSIKEICQKRKWFSNNNNILIECCGEYYKGEVTDWDNVRNRIDIAGQIIKFFGKEQVPSKLIKYLISREYPEDSFALFKNDIENINNKNIISRLNNLLITEDNQNLEFDYLLNTLKIIEEGVNVSNDKYVGFSTCSKDSLPFETIMADIILLNEKQEIEQRVTKNLSQLQSNFELLFEGMNTDWGYVVSSLNYASKFNDLCKTYSLSNEYINGVCNDKNIAAWASKYHNELSIQHTDIKSDFKWFSNLFDNGEEFNNTSIYTMSDRTEKCLNNLTLLEEWIDFRSVRQQCREEGLSEFVEKVEQMGMYPDVIIDTFFKRFYRMWLDVMIPRYPAVYAFRSRSHQAIINEFNLHDVEQLKIARLRILERLIERLPNTNIATSSVDEVGILKRELTKQRKIMPLRRLFKAIPNLLTALKPCLMMSPLSVSLFLLADGYNFDTVIFDEASQVCTEDAIGAIMRGKQVIIAGDSKQLPPTSFFATSFSDGDFDVDADDDEFDDTGAYDSILEEAVNAIPERTLKWHYRSRHEHLIAFSNAKIYNHELITFPSNIDRIPDNGVEYVFVENGVYDRGGKKNNLNEAKRVAGLVFEHIRKYPDRSLGVVTFSEAQQQAVDSAISQLRQQNGQYESFFTEDSDHAFFVKNLENVQGDERDTIIFSIGYAKDQNGVMYMNFGPLIRNGGHRRLNVAITRAKYNIKLVGSIHPTDIKIENTNSEGLKMLRQYIEFAINGASVIQNELHFNNTVDVDSPFEEAVYDFLIKNGYNVTTQVGCSGYRIDMAVKHPTLSGIFVLGIECDGATYHSARTARERDRLRQTVLEDIGWKIYRIWSTDWIKDPKTEGNKLLDAVKMAISNYKISYLNTGSVSRNETANEDTIPSKDNYLIVETDKDTNNDNPYNFSYYTETDVYKTTTISNDTQSLADVIDYVVELECPIHYELLCKRVATLFGNQKATVKVRNSVDNVLVNHLKDVVVKKGDFCWHKNIKEVQVKIPSPYGEGRAINHISIEELAEAMFVIAQKSFGIIKNDLFVVTARVFGFNRTGGNITQSMERACSYLIKNGRVKEVDSKIVS